METPWNAIVWSQFGAAIDMLENAIVACPEELWGDRSEPQQFWYVTFHCLFWLDFYLSGSEEGFAPPAPFTLDEFDPAGILPERVYTKQELLDYLNYGRKKCQTTIAGMSDQQARQTYRFGWGETSFAELLLYNMRHVQEHAAQLNLLLGQKYGLDPRWVAKAKNKPS